MGSADATPLCGQRFAIAITLGNTLFWINDEHLLLFLKN
jgi:hypothetical protein